MDTDANWRHHAERLLLAEWEQARRTPLRELPLPQLPGRRLVFKDESLHATGSLKHRLARSLFLHGLRNGTIGPRTVLYDASSGNTAISEAAFAKMLGLRFFAVVPANTSPAKQAQIRQFGGECVLLEQGCCKEAAARLAGETAEGHFLDQFGMAAVAVDWREHNVVTEMLDEFHEYGWAEPDWFVNGAGTGGTATCAGRHFRERGLKTEVVVVDPEDSAFFDHYTCGTASAGCLCASRVEGIGRPDVEASFKRELVDRMLRVPDAASFAAARWLSHRLRHPVGISTGTNLIGAICLLDAVDEGTAATLVCDDGRRYAGRLDNDRWLGEQGIDIAPWMRALDYWQRNGDWKPPVQTRVSVSAGRR